MFVTSVDYFPKTAPHLLSFSKHLLYEHFGFSCSLFCSLIIIILTSELIAETVQKFSHGDVYRQHRVSNAIVREAAALALVSPELD